MHIFICTYTYIPISISIYIHMYNAPLGVSYLQHIDHLRIICEYGSGMPNLSTLCTNVLSFVGL